MADPFNPHDVDRLKTTYTLIEAIDLMKMLDKYPTTKTIRWVNHETKEPVAIGYN